MSESFEEMLKGGHSNSLGRTIEVVDLVLTNPEKLSDLYNCYFSEDEVVRLRILGCLKQYDGNAQQVGNDRFSVKGVVITSVRSVEC